MLDRLAILKLFTAVFISGCAAAQVVDTETTVSVETEGRETSNRHVRSLGTVSLPIDVFVERQDEAVMIRLDEKRTLRLVEKRRRATRTGRTIVVGEVEGTAQSRFLMLLEGSLVRAEIRLGREVINLSSPRVESGQLLFQLSIVDSAVIPDERESVRPQQPQTANDERREDEVSNIPPPRTVSAGDSPQAGNTAANPVVVQIMVPYTLQAAQAVSNTPFGNIESLIVETIEFANYGLEEQSNVSLELVWMGQLPYTETGNIAEDLRRLACPCDHKLSSVGTNHLNEVFEPWKSSNADIVSLWIHSPNIYDTGIGYVLDPIHTAFAPLAVNVVDWGAAAYGYTFDHEVAHNFGALHDRAQEDDVANDYNYGFINIVLQQASIMAYKSTCESYGVECIRVANWSDPTLGPPGVWGIANGVLAAHNARTLMENASTVSNFNNRHDLVGCCKNYGGFFNKKWAPGPCPP